VIDSQSNISQLPRGSGVSSIANYEIKKRNYNPAQTDVFILDLGSNALKYGWSSDSEPCVLNQSYSKPFFSSRKLDYALDNEVLIETIKLILKSSGYKKDNPIAFCSSLPTICEGNSELLDVLFEEDVVLTTVPSHVYCGNSALLSSCTFSTNETMLVVELGFSSTCVYPVYCGSTVSYAGQRFNFGSYEMLQFMAHLSGVSLSKNIKDIKAAFESNCRVVLDYEEEMKKSGFEKSSEKRLLIAGYACKDKSKNKSRKFGDFPVSDVAEISAAELLFAPELFGTNFDWKKPLDAVVKEVLDACPLLPELSQNILVSGLGSFLPNLGERLTSELVKQGVKDPQVKVARKHSAWHGAKTFAKQKNFKSFCCTPEQNEVTWFKYRFPE
jgi:actin-related protein